MRLTCSSYTQAWLPPIPWQRTNLTGPRRLEASKQLSSDMICFRFVYANTWLPPRSWQKDMPKFSPDLRPIVSRQVFVSTFLTWILSNINIIKINKIPIRKKSMTINIHLPNNNSLMAFGILGTHFPGTIGNSCISNCF